MSPATIWNRISEWLPYLPIRLAYRIIWLAAKLNLGSARMVHRAMWNANLSVPEIRPETPNG